MATDCFTQNEAFLKSKGIVLQQTNSMFIPYKFENEDYFMTLSEYMELSVHNKKTGSRHSVNLIMEVLEPGDLD